ncbi:MAG: hypothetical protein LC676_07235 [Loktanella sp.]|nr:hypothetical protein [Loktanella sp.]
MNDEKSLSEYSIEFSLVSECGQYRMYKSGQGLSTQYVVVEGPGPELEFDPFEPARSWVCDTQAGFYHPQAVWKFPHTQAPDPGAIEPPSGWMLLGHTPKGFMRLIADKSSAGPGKPPMAHVQRWDGVAYETYVAADLASLARLVDLTRRDGWLGTVLGPIEPEFCDLSDDL